MKRICAICLLLVVLTGCGAGNGEVGQASVLRQTILEGKECKFHGEVTADYGDAAYSFGMDCVRDNSGSMEITVTAPETIAGITAKIQGSTGQLTFDDKALFFELIADGQITPVCAPWLLMEALCGGYISSCGQEGKGIRIQIDDSFSDTQYSAEVWTDEKQLPAYGEIVWQGRRILSIDISDFVIV